MVKLDYDSLAAYRGGIEGLPGTSPAKTGKPLDVKGADAKKYGVHIEKIENTFLAELKRRLPGARAGQRLRTVYGGMALSIPANKAAELLKLPGVAAVQDDRREELLTDSSPAFIGAPTIYGKLGGSASSGKGVIVGVLDSGAWPEHPQFADPGTLPAAPPTRDGTPRVCDFGDNPLTPATDPFPCNNKLIGGAPFLDTYNAVIGGEVYPDSARDSNGHGTHTATTAAAALARRQPAGHQPRPDPRRRPGRARVGLQGLRPGGLLQLRLGAGGRPGHPRRRAGDQLLDLRRLLALHRPGRAGLPRRLRGGRAGVGLGGNAGPGADTVDHVSPWVTTVAASTQTRTFQSTITLAGSGGAAATLKGASITGSRLPAAGGARVGSAVLERAVHHPGAPGLFTGKIVACERGPGRVIKSFNVRQGGAAGMILYNTSPLDVMTDNHWLPTVHIDKPETDALLAFLSANPGATASFTQGTKTTWQGDAITTFSSRGPGGLPQAGRHRPRPAHPGRAHADAGGRGRRSPRQPVPGHRGHLDVGAARRGLRGAAVRAAPRLDAGPGEVRAGDDGQDVGHQAGPRHPADPFDTGGGRIDLTKAGDPGLTFDETAANFTASAADPLNRIDLNLPSVNAPTMPGMITAKRTVTNVTNRTLVFTASGTTVAARTSRCSPAAHRRAGQERQAHRGDHRSRAARRAVLRPGEPASGRRRPAPAPAGGLLPPGGRDPGRADLRAVHHRPQHR
nr:hypothetical protein GCM10020093_000450 [Planobispora longispora]